MRLLCWNEYHTLPMVAAERTKIGLQPVVTGPAAAAAWRSLEIANAPGACLGQCKILSPAQIDATPSHLTHVCQTCAAKAQQVSASDSSSDLFESDVG